MPDPYSEKALKIALYILRSISLSSSRGEILEKLREQYPGKSRKLRRIFVNSSRI